MGLLLFFLIAVPWHIGVSMANPEFPNFYFLHEHFQRYLEKNHGLLYRWWFFIPVLLLGFLPWTALLPQAVRHALAIRWKSQEQFRLNMFLILWANCVFLFFTVSSSKLVPYILPLFPPLAILVGNYLAGAEESHGFGRLPAGAWAGVGGSLLILGIGLMVVPRFLPQNIDAVGIDGYLYGSASIIAAGSVAVLFWVKSSKFRRAFLSLVAAWILCLSLLSSGSSLFDDRRSVKKLAVALALRLQPGDEVASYRAYYQDLPVYLKRRVLVVGRLGELSFGAKQEDVSAWIMDDAAFWRQWNGPKTIYLLTSRDRYDKLRGEIGREVYLIAQTDWHVVLANKSGDRS